LEMELGEGRLEGECKREGAAGGGDPPRALKVIILGVGDTSKILKG